MSNIPKLSLEDVLDVEGDLSYYEKVSIFFLLIQDNVEIEFFLQQLIVLSKQPENTQSTTLFEWARRKQVADWNCLLIESFCIARSNHVLRKLGCDLAELRLVHFPHRPEIVTNVKPIMKILYHMSEKLSVSECKALIESISKKFGCDLNELFVPKCLELHVFQWVSKGILKLMPIVDVQELVDYFKFNDNLEIYDFLKSNIERLPKEESSPKFKKGNVLDEEIRRPSTTTLSSINNIDDHLSYQFDPISPGILLIINQFTFEIETNPHLSHLLPLEKLTNRNGTEKDVEALEKTFKQFNYQIVVESNLKDNEILDKIRVIMKMVKKSHSSVIISILSHGIEGCVYGSNSIPVEVRDIKNVIYEHTENLLGKPKILIVQACQGQDLQISRRVENCLETDSPAVSIPPCSDFLIAWSTVEGFASFRHTLNGTWFIQTLCETLLEKFKSKHLIDILTMVTNKISSMKGNKNESMIPKIESTFRKNLYFVDK